MNKFTHIDISPKAFMLGEHFDTNCDEASRQERIARAAPVLLEALQAAEKLLGKNGRVSLQARVAVTLATGNIDPRLTHIIICDSGNWAKGASYAEALEQFTIHLGYRGFAFTDPQVWFVTESTVVCEDGMFRGTKADWCSPVPLTWN